MEIVSVINYKGGVGKTTIVANVAAELGWRGKRVLLIDLDPQASLTFSFLNVDKWQQEYAAQKTIKNWYDAYIDGSKELELASLIINPPIVKQILTGRDNQGIVDLICSHLALINIDLELATMLGGGSLRQTRNNFLRLHSRLVEGLESPDVQNAYDYVLIDCPPNFNVVTKTAIVASDWILVPAIPDFLSTIGVEELRRHIRELVGDFNGFVEMHGDTDFEKINPAIMGVIPTMVQLYGGQPIQAQAQFVDRIKRTGLPVFDAFVRRNNSRFAAAPEYGVPLVLQEVTGHSSGPLTREIISELEELTTEIMNRI